MKLFCNYLITIGIFLQLYANAQDEFDMYTSIEIEPRVDIESLNLRSINSKCYKEALKEIIEICISEGPEAIDPSSRKELALKLSICEFRASGVNYPPECHILYTADDYLRCISKLEKIPQYWTTFSGNYRDIGRICYEESLPYQKDHIIGLYSNISSIYREMYKDMERGQKMSEESIREFKLKFDSLLDIVEVHLQQQKEYQTEISKEQVEFNKEVKKAMNQTISELREFTGEFETSVDDINVYINNTVNELEGLSYTMKDYNFIDQVNQIKLKISGEFTDLENFSNDIVYKIMNNFESTSEVIIENINITNELSQSIHYNKNLMDDFKLNVNQNNDLIHSQNVILRSEFEQSVISFSKMMDEQLEVYLEKSSALIESQIKELVDDIYHDLNDTIVSLNRVSNQLRFYSNTINNATLFMYQGLRKVTDNKAFYFIINLKDYSKKALKILLQLSHSLWIRLTKFIFVLLIFVFLMIKLAWLIFEVKLPYITRTFTPKIQATTIYSKSIIIGGCLVVFLSILSGIYFAILVSRFAVALKGHVEAYNEFDIEFQSI